MKYRFDHSKLRGRIVEKCGSIERFSRIIGISQTTVGKKLSDKSYWTQEEIMRACTILEIPSNELSQYFFCEAS